MIVQNTPFFRIFIATSLLAVSLSLIGNLAPGIVAKIAGHALFGMVLIGPALLLYACLRFARQRSQRSEARSSPSMVSRMTFSAGFLAKAIIGAIGVIFLIVLIAVVIGDNYPGTATRVAIISCIGLFFVAAGMRLLWMSFGPARYYFHGIARLTAGEGAAALERLEEDKRRRPSSEAPWVASSISHLALGRGEAALSDAARALELRRSWEALHARGVALHWAGAYEEAMRDLEAAAAVKRMPIVQASIGAVLVDQRRLDAAIKVLLWSFKRFPFMTVALTLGEAYRLRGMNDEARRAYEGTIILTKATRHRAAGGIAAYALAQLARPQEAIEAASTALAHEEFRSTALAANALASMRLGDLATTASALRELMDKSPNLCVGALMDPDSTPLLTDDRFRSLLAEALEARDRVLERIREA